MKPTSKSREDKTADYQKQTILGVFDSAMLVVCDPEVLQKRRKFVTVFVGFERIRGNYRVGGNAKQ